MQPITMEAAARPARGKNKARQLRRAGQVPAVVYGGKDEPLALAVDPRAVEKVLTSEAGHNAIFTLEIKGHGKTPAMIRDWQYEPVKGTLLHVDFLRIAMDARLKLKVPVQFKGEAKGVKQQGGILEFVLREVELECLPADIPESLEVDVAELTIGHGIRVGDLKVDPRKIKVLSDPERVIAHVIAPRAEEEKPVEEAVAVAATPTAAAPAEPELVRKPRAEKGEEGSESEAAAAAEKKEKKEKK